MAAVPGPGAPAQGGGAGETPPHGEGGAFGTTGGREINTRGDARTQTGRERTQGRCLGKKLRILMKWSLRMKFVLS